MTGHNGLSTAIFSGRDNAGSPTRQPRWGAVAGSPTRQPRWGAVAGSPPRTPARWGASGAARQSIREVAPLIRSLVELESRCRVERPRIERPRPLCRRISRERWEILAPDADLAEHCWQAARSPERLESRRELLGGGGDTFFNARGDPTPARHVSRIRARRRPQALVGPYIAGGPACPPHDIARRGGRVCPPHQKMAIAIADMIRVPADDVLH